ncbi:unnamed protein product [Kuraishia capsulata CBS 1993]|uniref:Probable quinone oxidoreductase n=1 Tax=Kuraishia capsulata CBS 1993 TaxID=1382522 RepID=W6MG87_9ASCO|nr:uncharacterized protein KUCA_T00000451001 [Kuraishia capsulata CBS 1993]CDK24488.1 unnamed protein product [Kuraishia capsulata CBS 1993]
MLSTFKRAFSTSFTHFKMSIPKTSAAVYFKEQSESLDVLTFDPEYATPQIQSPTEVLIKNRYAGINFIEAYFRKGIYPVTELPYVLGREASGTVAAIGSEVKDLSVGDKVAYLSGKTFAQYTLFDTATNHRYLKLDPATTDKELLLYGSALVQGLTALTIIEDSYPVKKGDDILVTAAAGGVGLLLDQLISGIGARVIAVASTADKLELAKKAGASVVINSETEDVVARIKEATGGKGVEASFDGVGKATFEISYESLARKGSLVSFGNASGTVPPLSINRLSPKNLKLVRPQVFGYTATKEEWLYYSSKLVGLLKSGKLKLDITEVFPLKNFKLAAEKLEGRKTTGKLALEIPE